MITDIIQLEYINCDQSDPLVIDAFERFNRGDYGNALTIIDIAYNHHNTKNFGTLVGKYQTDHIVMNIAFMQFNKKAIISKHERFTTPA